MGHVGITMIMTNRDHVKLHVTKCSWRLTVIMNIHDYITLNVTGQVITGVDCGLC